MPNDYKDKISDDDKKTIEDAVKEAKEVLNDKDADKDKLESAAKDLSGKIMHIGAKMYQQSTSDGSDQKDGKDQKGDKDDGPVEGEVVE